MLEVRDIGAGIPANKIHKVFAEQESDQTGANFDGTGLGLPICAQLCLKIGAFIRYTSQQGEKSGTTFQLYIEDHCDPIYHSSDEKLEFDFLNKDCVSDATLTHTCNMLLIAEDSKSIMRRYTIWLDKQSMPYQAFCNGKDLYDFVRKSG